MHRPTGLEVRSPMSLVRPTPGVCCSFLPETLREEPFAAHSVAGRIQALVAEKQRFLFLLAVN